MRQKLNAKLFFITNEQKNSVDTGDDELDDGPCTCVSRRIFDVFNVPLELPFCTKLFQNFAQKIHLPSLNIKMDK